MTLNGIHTPTNAIKHHGIHSWSSSGDSWFYERIAKLDVEVLERTSMIPVTHKDGVPCFIPIGTRGSMDKQWTSNAVRILERVMTVVPGMTVLGRLEFVGESVIGSYGTLRNPVDSIICICMKLTYAMPVDSSSVVWMVVGNMNCLGASQLPPKTSVGYSATSLITLRLIDRAGFVESLTYNIITPASLDQRTRVSIIEDFALSLQVAVWRDRLSRHVEPILALDTLRPL